LSILTKVFIVLQLVVALVLAVMIVIGFKNLENYKNDVELARKGQLSAQAAFDVERAKNQLGETRLADTQKQLSDQVTALKAQVEGLQGQVASITAERDSLDARNVQFTTQQGQLTASVTALKDQLAAKDDELKQVRPEITRLIAQNAELSRVNNELTTQLNFATAAIRKLQEALAASSEKAGAVVPSSESKSSVVTAVQAPVQVNAKISSVQLNNGRTFVTVPLGTRDGVKVGTQFTVSRGNAYIGDASVTRTTVDESVIQVTLVKPGQTVLVSDLATSVAGQ